MDDDDNLLFVPQPRAKQRVIDAVNELGLRVLPNDVVGKTGLPVAEATSLLNKVAAETRATLQVTDTGEIYYVFPRRFQGAYAVRGMERTLRVLFLNLFRTAFFAARVSFGVMLVLSVLVVVVLIIACIVAICAAALGGDGGGDSGGSWDFGGGDWLDLGSLGDGFSWNYTDSHQRKIEHYGVADKSWRPKEQVKKGNFFLECFSFLFGDGDPNPYSEELRWKMIAEVIRANNFVVVAEQIAPYTGRNPKDDSAMFETLARFDGQPVVTEQGTILYTFDAMRRQVAYNTAGERVHVPRYFELQEWRFSEYPAPSLITVLMFATGNFLGSWWLFRHIATINFLQHFVVLIDVLLGYGALFLLIPFARIIFNEGMNNWIRAENRKREEFSMLLRTPEVRSKLNEAQDFVRQLPRTSEARSIVYSTDKDIVEQQF